jgi:hypothetical protein
MPEIRQIQEKEMKKGTEAWPDYDDNGRWCLKCRKQRGRFDLDELTEIAKEWEEDFYAIIIKAIDEEDLQYYDDCIDTGDYVTLYRATDFMRRE